MKLKNTVEALETLGFDVLLVDPEDQERLVGMIELVAFAANQEEEAQQLLAFINEQQTRSGSWRPLNTESWAV